MNEPKEQMSLISNVWIKLMNFEKAGDFNPGHSHVFDHPTLLVKGSVKVEVDGKETVFTAPHIIFIRKEKEHTITALEDDTVAACIHAIRDGDAIEDIVDPSMIPDGTDILNMYATIPNLKKLAYGEDPRSF
jgi:hypothetical protein